jgi:hypothetical protein
MGTSPTVNTSAGWHNSDAGIAENRARMLMPAPQDEVLVAFVIHQR